MILRLVSARSVCTAQRPTRLSMLRVRASARPPAPARSVRVAPPRVRAYSSRAAESASGKTNEAAPAESARPSAAAARPEEHVRVSRGLLSRNDLKRGVDDNTFDQFNFEEVDDDVAEKLLHQHQRATLDATEEAMRVSLRMVGQPTEELCRIIDSVVADATARADLTPIEQVVQHFRAEAEKYTPPRPANPSPDAIQLQRLSGQTNNPATWGAVTEPLAFSEETYMKELKATYDLRKDHQALGAHATAEHTADRDNVIRFPDPSAIVTSEFAGKIFKLEEPHADELDMLLTGTPKERMQALPYQPVYIAKNKDSDKDSEEDEDMPTQDELDIEAEREAHGGEVPFATPEQQAKNAKKERTEDLDPKNAPLRKLEIARSNALNTRMPLEGSLGPFAEGSSSRVDILVRKAIAGLATEAAQYDVVTANESADEANLALHKQHILQLHTITNFDHLKTQLAELRNELEDKLLPNAQEQVWQLENQQMSDKEFEESLASLQIDASEDMTEAEHRELIVKYLQLARDMQHGQDTSRLQDLQERLTKSLSNPPGQNHVEEILRSWAGALAQNKAEEEEEERLEALANSEEAVTARELEARSIKGKSHRKKMSAERGLSHGQREKMKNVGKAQHHLPHHLPYGDDEDHWPIMKVIEVKPHVNVTKAGRVSTFSSSVLIGNGEGSAGFGYARGKDAKEATDRAIRDAYRNIITIDRFEDRTIPYPIEAKYCRTKVVMRGMPNFGGMRCHDEMKDLMEAFGFEDIFVKVYHRRVLSHLYKAVFNALEKIKAPETIAKQRGKIFFNPAKVLVNRPQWGL